MNPPDVSNLDLLACLALWLAFAAGLVWFGWHLGKFVVNRIKSALGGAWWRR